MSTVNSLASFSSLNTTLQNSNSIDNQIAALEKRIADGVNNGNLTSQQGAEMTKGLDELKQIIDEAGNASSDTTGLTGIGMNELSNTLREIGQQLSKIAQANQSSGQTTSTAASATTGNTGGSSQSGVNVLT